MAHAPAVTINIGGTRVGGTKVDPFIYYNSTVSGGTNFEIYTQQVERDVVNALIKIPKPVAKGQQGTTDPKTIAKDIKKITDTLVITGRIPAANNPTSGVTSAEANFINMVNKMKTSTYGPENAMLVTYRNHLYLVLLDKLKMTDIFSSSQRDRVNNANTPEKLTIVISLTLGNTT